MIQAAGRGNSLGRNISEKKKKKKILLNPYLVSSKLAYCQLPNLCKLVVRAELKPTISNPGGHGCNSDRCATYKYLHKACGISSAPAGSWHTSPAASSLPQGSESPSGTAVMSPWVGSSWDCSCRPRNEKGSRPEGVCKSLSFFLDFFWGGNGRNQILLFLLQPLCQGAPHVLFSFPNVKLIKS